MQKIQDRAFYFIESAPTMDKMPSKRLSVEKIITYDRAIMVHKILRKRCPENLKGKFTRRNQISKYETRRMHDLQIPKPRLELSKRRFSYVGAKVWNDVPYAIRNVESTHLFKYINTHPLGQSIQK